MTRTVNTHDTPTPRHADALIEQAPLAEAMLNSGFPLLTFPAILEEVFQRHGQDKRFETILAAGLASIVIFGGLIFVDMALMPDIVPLAIAMRLGFYTPATIAVLFILHKRRDAALTEWTAAVMGMVSGLISVTLFIRSDSPWAFPAVAQLNFAVLYVCAYARFWPAVALSAVLAAGHALVLLTVPDRTGLLALNMSLMLGVTICFTLYGSYKMEHDDRMAFLQDIREKALDRERLTARDHLAAMATTDALTGLANRRYFDTHLDKCLQEARAQGRALSLALIDIDHFKLYNDHHGHQAGDRCLMAVAQALKSCTRQPSDLVARWGGEEFAIVMFDTDARGAAEAGERLKQQVHQLHLPHVASKTAGMVTISTGLVSIAPGAAWNMPSLVRLADEALYQAKASGRDRVVQRAPHGDEERAHA